MPKLATLTVSRQGFGAMGLSSAYGAADDAESIRTLHRAIDLGITFFDTATGYGAGHNETLLGKAIADRRDGLVIASKFTHRAGGSDAPPIKARDAVEASLGRLGLDFIDLYHLHRVDLQIPIEESVGELGRLRDEGKIGGVGVSEATADGLRRANAAYRVTALQSEYSLWTRGVEAEILPTARELGVGFVSYSPLGRGFLAGTEVTDPKDRRHQHPRFQPEAVAANSRRRATIEQVADRLGRHSRPGEPGLCARQGRGPDPRHAVHPASGSQLGGERPGAGRRNDRRAGSGVRARHHRGRALPGRRPEAGAAGAGRRLNRRRSNFSQSTAWTRPA
jgi:aryl-alcohol dehydrogenase-like predicted oxidoreductase